MFPLSYVTDVVRENTHPLPVSEMGRFTLLDQIVTAQIAANHAVSNSYKNLYDRGMRSFSYTERHWILTDVKAMEIAQRVLLKRYGNITLKWDTEENQVDVTWGDAYPKECTAEEVQEGKNGELLAAVATNQTGLVKVLLRDGANVNAKGPFGRTPLYAVMKDPLLLEYLISQGANVNVIDEFGMTPLDVANTFNPASVFAQVLQKHGAVSKVEKMGTV